MRWRIVFPALTVFPLIIAGPALAAHLIVTVYGARNNQGNIFVGLYASPAKFLHGNQTDAVRKTRASTGPVTVVFEVPPGTYAVGAFHDENSNDHLDTDFLGLPTEGYALSNGVRAVFSKPNFYQAAFTIGAGDTQLSLHIRY
jgi:uncharacterized protein (DUF2141 family)